MERKQAGEFKSLSFQESVFFRYRKAHLFVERVVDGVSDSELVAGLDVALGDLAVLEDDRVLAVGGDVLDAQPVARNALDPGVHRREMPTPQTLVSAKA